MYYNGTECTQASLIRKIIVAEQTYSCVKNKTSCNCYQIYVLNDNCILFPGDFVQKYQESLPGVEDRFGSGSIPYVNKFSELDYAGGKF